jgi:DNA invertase Pin-like site-specific DNA recombinase
MTTKVAIYTRVSTEKQAEKYSLAAQRRILREHAARKGWEVVGEYEDPGISGETIEARPAFRSLLEEAGAGAFDILLTIDTDRLSRSKDLRTWADILDTLREGGVKIATPTQILDPEDEEDVFLTHLFGILAAREKAKILRRMRRGMEQAVREGRKMGCSRDPYGYRYDRNLRKLVLEPEEAKIVRRVFDSYLDGLGLLGIVRQFVAEGISTRKGGPWSPAQLQSILGGIRHARDTRYGAGAPVTASGVATSRTPPTGSGPRSRATRPSSTWRCGSARRTSGEAGATGGRHRTTRRALTS